MVAIQGPLPETSPNRGRLRSDRANMKTTVASTRTASRSGKAKRGSATVTQSGIHLRIHDDNDEDEDVEQDETEQQVGGQPARNIPAQQELTGSPAQETSAGAISAGQNPTEQRDTADLVETSTTQEPLQEVSPTASATDVATMAAAMRELATAVAALQAANQATGSTAASAEAERQQSPTRPRQHGGVQRHVGPTEIVRATEQEVATMGTTPRVPLAAAHGDNSMSSEVLGDDVVRGGGVVGGGVEVRTSTVSQVERTQQQQPAEPRTAMPKGVSAQVPGNMATGTTPSPEFAAMATAVQQLTTMVTDLQHSAPSHEAVPRRGRRTERRRTAQSGGSPDSPSSSGSSESSSDSDDDRRAGDENTTESSDEEMKDDVRRQRSSVRERRGRHERRERQPRRKSVKDLELPTFTPSPKTSVVTWIDRVDLALKGAKASGRGKPLTASQIAPSGIVAFVSV